MIGLKKVDDWHEDILNAYYLKIYFGQCHRRSHSHFHLGLDERVHLVEVAASPHHPHGKSSHYQGHQSDPKIINAVLLILPFLPGRRALRHSLQDFPANDKAQDEPHDGANQDGMHYQLNKYYKNAKIHTHTILS